MKDDVLIILLTMTMILCSCSLVILDIKTDQKIKEDELIVKLIHQGYAPMDAKHIIRR